MAKLYFRYGAMGASKTAQALMVHYNYIERGIKAIIIKPDKDLRYGNNVIKSRIGLEYESLYTLEDIKAYIDNGKIKLFGCIIIDEVQFLEPEDIDLMSTIVDNFDIPVICYGLRTDFRGNLFPASERLLAIADVIEEIPTICWCGRKAQMNARIEDGEVVREGEQIVLGSNDLYVGLCRKHFFEGRLS